MKGLIFDMKRFAIHDGPGIRLTVFFKGCPLKCDWCHNPEGIDSGIQTVRRIRQLGSGEFLEADEEVGKWVTTDELISEIEKDVVFFDESGGGVTFSGGEPLMQVGFLEEILKACRERDIHTAVDTSGYAPFASFDRILHFTDLFLFDLKLVDDEDHRRFTGVSNESILDNLSRLSRAGARINLRFPVIPGITDTEKNIAAVKKRILAFPNIRVMNLLPFHNSASAKYERFHRANPLAGETSLSGEELEPLRAELEACDINVTIGG